MFSLKPLHAAAGNHRRCYVLFLSLKKRTVIPGGISERVNMITGTNVYQAVEDFM